MHFLIILDTEAGETERTENALQLALAVTRRDDVTVRLFVLGDAVAAARAEPGMPDGPAGTVDGEAALPARTLHHLVMSGVEIAVCDASLAARGIARDELMVGATASPLSLLADWALVADRVLTF